MKFLFCFLIFCLIACTQGSRKENKSYSVAYDSISQNRVKAAAIKKSESSGVCFEVTLWLKDITWENGHSGKWSIAWVDSHKQYHLISMSQRNPSSVPKKKEDEWKNILTACAPEVQFSDVSALVLTPKNTEEFENQELRLNWSR